MRRKNSPGCPCCGPSGPPDDTCRMPIVPIDCTCEGGLPKYLLYTETGPSAWFQETLEPLRLTYRDETLVLDNFYFPESILFKEYWISECGYSRYTSLAGEAEDTWAVRIVIFGRRIVAPFVLDDEDNVIDGADGGCYVVHRVFPTLSGTKAGAEEQCGPIQADPSTGGGVSPTVWLRFCGGGDPSTTLDRCIYSWACDPFSAFIDFDSGSTPGVSEYFGAGFLTEGPLRPTDPETITCKDGCWARISRVITCKETCSSTDRFRVRDTVSGVVYGPFSPTIYGATFAGGCEHYIQSATVFNPGEPVGDGTYIITPRDFEIIDDETDLVLATVTVDENCVADLIREGADPNGFRVRLCVEGCPGGPLPNVDGVVYVESTDGATVHYSKTVSTTTGCITASIPLNIPEDEFRVRFVLSADYPGYEAEKVVTATYGGESSLPEGCDLIDLAPVAFGPDEDHVCTCAGLMPRCLVWTGNGSAIFVWYDDEEGAWLGFETIFEGAANDTSLCLDEPPFGVSERADMPVKLEVLYDEEEEECYFLVTRLTPICFCGGEFGFPPCETVPCIGTPNGFIGTPRLGGYDLSNPSAIDLQESIQRATIFLPWGPLGSFPSRTFFAWTRPNGSTDPDCCHAPCQAYAGVTVEPCP